MTRPDTFVISILVLRPDTMTLRPLWANDSIMKKLKLDRIISIATLIASLAAIVLVLQKPAPVAQPQAPAAIAAHAQSFEQKMTQLQPAAQATTPASSGWSAASQTSSSLPSQPAVSSSEQTRPEVRLSSDEVGAALAQALGQAAGGASPLVPRFEHWK